MPKFEATKLGDLLTAERNAGRAARVKGYAAMGETFTHIVATEASDGSWCEFDATDLEHAKRLADNAVEKLNARGCSVWAINPETGKLKARSPLYTRYWVPDDIED